MANFNSILGDAPLDRWTEIYVCTIYPFTKEKCAITNPGVEILMDLEASRQHMPRVLKENLCVRLIERSQKGIP